LGTCDGNGSTVDELAAAIEVLWECMAGKLTGVEGGDPMLELFEVNIVCVVGADTKEELPVASRDIP